jgi:hypothetical protein
VCQLLGVVFVVLALLAVSVIDADGDPTTTNLPSIVLADRVTTEHDAILGRSNRRARAGRKVIAPLCRRLGALLIVPAERCHARVQPIRGP